MKRLIVSITLLVSTACFAQGAESVNTADKPNKKSKKVSFVTKIDINNATKDGIYLEGYVVNIDYEKAKELDGKSVRISGKVTIVKGIQQDSSGVVAQGRQHDTRYILRPKIEVISKQQKR